MSGALKFESVISALFAHFEYLSRLNNKYVVLEFEYVSLITQQIN